MEFLADWKDLMLLPAILAWLALGRRQPAWVHWAGAQVCLAIVFELFGKFTSACNVSNHWAYNIYMFLEFGMLSMILFHMPFAPRYIRGQLLFCALLFITVFLWDSHVHHSFFEFSTNALIVGGLLLAAQAFLALLRISTRGESAPLGRGDVWALLSIMLSFLCFVPSFGLYNYLTGLSEERANDLLTINDVLFILRYGLVSLGFLLVHRTDKAAP